MITTTTYDVFDQPTDTYCLAPKCPSFHSEHNIYDVSGHLTSTTDYTGITNGTDPDRSTVHYYDWRGRLVTTSNAINTTVTQYSPDGLTQLHLTYQTPAGWSNTPLPDTPQTGVPGAYNSTLGTGQAPLYAATLGTYDAWDRMTQTQAYNIVHTATTTGVAPNLSLANTVAALAGIVASPACPYLTTTYDYDNRGHVTTETDPGGLVTDTSYDGAGRVTLTDVGSATQAVEYTKTTYSDVASTVLVETGQLKSDGQNYCQNFTAKHYDAAGRVNFTADYGTTNPGSAPTSAPTSSNTLLVTKYENGSDTLTGTPFLRQYMIVTDPMGTRTRYNYDALGRVVEEWDNYQSGSPLIVGTDTNRLTSTCYDAFDRISQTLLTNIAPGPGSTLTTTSLTTKYDYMPKSNGGTTEVIAYADHTSETYVYDALGQKVSYTQRDGTEHQYSYDALGHLASDRVTNFGSNISQIVQNLSYTYDALGRRILATSEGPKDAAWGVINQVKDVYNGYGQVITEYQEHSGEVRPQDVTTNGTTTPASYKVQYLYDQSGNYSRLQQLVYPYGRIEWYSCGATDDLNNAISRVSSISDVQTNAIGQPVWGTDGKPIPTQTLETYTYLGLDQVVGRTLPEPNITETTTLNSLNQVQNVNWTQGTTSVDQFSYNYNADGQVYKRTDDNYNLDNEIYNYDNLDRQTGFGVSGYTVDGLPNNPLPDTLLWKVDSAGNRYSTSYGSSYNAAGESPTGGYAPGGYTTTVNLGAQNSVALTYDAWGRVVKTNESGTDSNNAHVTYAVYDIYDALGREITHTNENNENKSVNASSDSQEYYDGTHLVEERSLDGKVVSQYVWSAAGGNHLILRDQNGEAIPRLYALTDAAGSITSLVGRTQTADDNRLGINAHWQVVERYLYTVDGQPIVVDANWSNKIHTATSSLYGWNFLYHGMQLVDLTVDFSTCPQVGLYQTAGGPAYDPQHGLMLTPNQASYANHQTPYDPGQVTLSGSQYFVAGGAQVVATVALSAVVILAFPVLAPIALVAGLGYMAWQAYQGWNQYGGASGAFAKASGVSAIYEGWTNQDWQTHAPLGMSDYERGAGFTGGIVQLASLIYAGASLGARGTGAASALWESRANWFGPGIGNQGGVAVAGATAIDANAAAAAAYGGWMAPNTGPAWLSSLGMFAAASRNPIYAEMLENGAIKETTNHLAGVTAPPQHHVFPQAYRGWFEFRGVNIDEFTVSLPESEHSAIHGGGNWQLGQTWQDEWNNAMMNALCEAEFKKGDVLAPQEIIDIGRLQMQRYGLIGHFEQYGG